MIENKKYDTQIANKKRHFLARFNRGATLEDRKADALMKAKGAAIKHNPLYKNRAMLDQSDHSRFYSAWGTSIVEAAENIVTFDQDLGQVRSIKQNMNDSYGKYFAGSGFRISHSQKGLTVYLKHLWCLGQIPEPPICPLDANVMWWLGRPYRNQAWTRIDSEEEYRNIVTAMNKAAKDTGYNSAAQWELDKFTKCPEGCCLN